MKLHDAIIKLLKAQGPSLTTARIAEELNANGWYKKKDGTLITDFQIHGRTTNYPQYFSRDSTLVSLKETELNL